MDIIIIIIIIIIIKETWNFLHILDNAIQKYIFNII